jgi:hypothetical protein
MMSSLYGLIVQFRGPRKPEADRSRFHARQAATLLAPICTSLFLWGLAQGPVHAHEPESLLRNVAATRPMLHDAIVQNTPGYSTGYPLGVPRTYAWCNGVYKPAQHTVPPPDFTAVTGWGRIYRKWERNPQKPASATDVTVTIANARTYVRLSATKEWVLVQDQDQDEVAGAHFVADFGPEAGLGAKLGVLPDGSVTIDGPPAGYNNLFWMIKRGAYAAGSVDGVYVQVDLKTNDPSMKLVADVGADWWRNEEAGFERGFANNNGVGASNWIELSDQWSTLYFYSGGTAQFEANPPPPFTDGDKQEVATITARQRAGAPTPCLRPVEGPTQ